MIESLIAEADAPPREVKGVGQGFLDGELLAFFLVGKREGGHASARDNLSLRTSCRGRERKAELGH